MKKVFLMAALMGLFACGGAKEEKYPLLSWETDQVTLKQDSSTVEVSYPVAVGEAVADSINRYITEALTADLSETPGQYKNVQQALDSVFAQKHADEVLRNIPYEVRSEGNVYEQKGVVSVRLDKYIYLGGAHGLSTTTYLNFDRKDGHLLSLSELVDDMAGLNDLNRLAFHEYLGGRGGDVTAEALFVAIDNLPLPQNVGLSEWGLMMVYNPYEIAPYVYGQFSYAIPYTESNAVLRDIAVSR